MKSRCTATLRNLGTAIGGSSKDILGFKRAYFLALQSQWIPICLLPARTKLYIIIHNFYSLLKHTVLFPASATQYDDNCKTTIATVYLNGLSSKQQFTSN